MCSSKPGVEGSVAYLTKIFGLKPKGKRRKGKYIYIAYIKIQSNHTDWLFFTKHVAHVGIGLRATGAATLRNLAWPWREEVALDTIILRLQWQISHKGVYHPETVIWGTPG